MPAMLRTLGIMRETGGQGGGVFLTTEHTEDTKAEEWKQRTQLMKESERENN
jgi:hypothetical protein